MNREQMVEKVWQSITSHSLDDWAAAEDAVATILPQVTTVEELEALPVATLLASERGTALQKSGTGSMVHLFSGRRWDCASALGQFGPLTEVWRP